MKEDQRAILSLDLGTTTGWAIKLQDSSIISGVVSFPNGRFEGGGMRFLKFRDWLNNAHSLSKIDEVYFEEVRRHLGVDAAHVYGGFLGLLTSWCESKNIPYSGIPVGTIKKHISGKGNASKDLVKEKVEDLGFKPKDDNEADALALLNCVMNGAY